MPRRVQPPPTPAIAKRILDRLEKAHPEARCALVSRTPFQLAVATILSAQCTDERVNKVTPPFFARFPDARSLAGADLATVEELIRSTGFFHAKAKNLTGFARGLVEHHEGDVPRTMQDLTRLPGIGRKTANVVLGHAYGIALGIAVDTHVLRVSNRLGLARSDEPAEIERQLTALIPKARWTRTSDLLIFHGRKVCDARRPDCGSCTVFDLCGWADRQAWAAPASPTRGTSGRKPAASRKTR